MKYEFRIEPGEGGTRVDKYLAEVAGVATRSQIGRRTSSIRVNGRPVKAAYRVVEGDHVVLELAKPSPSTLEAQDIPLRVLYEDARVVVIDKEQGMVVHPGAGNRDGTVANALLHHFSIDPADPERPGIVHRLDKDTSGVLIVAKDVVTHDYLVRQFSERSTRKRYLAIVKGNLGSGEIEGVIGRDPRQRMRFTSRTATGKRAATRYRALRHFDHYTYVLLEPLTGRTHQLRVHMHDAGTPILGDPVYARRDGRFPHATLMLHAYSLAIRVNPTEAPRTFVAPLPRRLRSLLLQLA